MISRKIWKSLSLPVNFYALLSAVPTENNLLLL